MKHLSFFIVLVFSVFLLACSSINDEEQNIPVEKYTKDELIAFAQSYKTDSKLVWNEEFLGTSLDETAWTKETHAKKTFNDEEQEYVKDSANSYVSDGTLKIKAIKDSEGNWTSARLITDNKKYFCYGFFEAKVKVPSEVGTWPAFWLLGATDLKYASTEDNNGGWWPNVGEIDIMEHDMRGGKSNVYSSLHRKAGMGGEGASTGNFNINIDDGQWHTFGLLWKEDVIAFFWDGEIKEIQYNYKYKNKGYYNVKRDFGYSREIPEGVEFKKDWYWWPYNHDFYVILNLAMGGIMGGEISPSVTEATYEVDYVKVWQ